MAPMLVQEVEDDAPSSNTLELTPVEQTLTRLLLDVSHHIDEHPSTPQTESHVELPAELANEKIVLRYTGGWVRDKLLGVPSHDIDVAINKMTGFQFGLRMKQYLEIPGNLEKYGLESLAANDKQSLKAGTTDKSKTVGGLHKIEANPEKSKHLETTTMRILGLDIDLVNLRKETYTDDSRNPEMEFGTPEEDALRRDATVNAMFYNLNTKETEDFTGRGHKDMARKVICTPLEPYQTFKDDPLRVLRLIRFASRLGYTIEAEVLEAARNPDIKEALRRKISRERVGVELEKALTGPDPQEALRLVFDLDLYETIFSDPAVADVDHYSPDVDGWQIVIDALSDVLSNGGTIADNLARDKEEQYFAWQLAAMVPYRDAPNPVQTDPNRKPPPPVAVTVVKEGIKATNRVSDVIHASVRNESEISGLVDKLYDRKRRPDKSFEGEDATARDVIGMAIRRWGATWRSQVVYAMLVEIANNQDQVEAIERKYTTFIEQVASLSLLEVISIKPLLDGKALAKAIGAPPGPWMKDALDVVMAWQLRNPTLTDPQQAIEEVKLHRSNGELSSDLIRHFLKLTIRPLFIKASPSSVTEAGRKVTTTRLPQKLSMQTGDENVTKPWKGTKGAFTLDILSWVISRLDEKIIAEIWPLVIPPILTLIDDHQPQYKTIGASLLDSLLKTTPPSLLSRTGLGEVFEDALLPCLTFTPPLTPIDEAIPLLQATYRALLTLAYVRIPDPPPPSSTAPDSILPHLARTNFLDKVLRSAFITPLAHSPSALPPPFLILIYTHLPLYLSALGLASVKHMQYILPLLTSTLTHPTSPATPEVLVNANATLQAVIQNGWPRVGGYKGEVVKAMVGCWIRCYGKEGLDGVREGLKETVRGLVGVLEEEEGKEVIRTRRELVGIDGRVAGLFDGMLDGNYAEET
ncbi:unnamed protein product [Zymoseptoria tritici ST99CH_1E4]|uniref:Poly A polymerase head domain-containing protein n=1 Tax=Zymoseptoria tritici ST99CH_1E4 TaxID=1276532 RepID=A0A2H1GYR4_ZYMTR|nr:unnamed protein product [Zymoseptoria tritici ST99CH_1E4]